MEGLVTSDPSAKPLVPLRSVTYAGGIDNSWVLRLGRPLELSGLLEHRRLKEIIISRRDFVIH